MWIGGSMEAPNRIEEDLWKQPFEDDHEGLWGRLKRSSMTNGSIQITKFELRSRD